MRAPPLVATRDPARAPRPTALGAAGVVTSVRVVQAAPPARGARPAEVPGAAAGAAAEGPAAEGPAAAGAACGLAAAAPAGEGVVLAGR